MDFPCVLIIGVTQMNAFTPIAIVAAPLTEAAIQTQIDAFIDRLMEIDDFSDELSKQADLGSGWAEDGVQALTVERKHIRKQLDALSDAMAQFIEPVFCMPEDLEPMEAELEASLQAYAALEMAPRSTHERAIWVEPQF